MADTGRKPLWETNEELVEVISGYWEYCADVKEIPDVESLADYLDTTRKTLIDYEKKEDFCYTIKKAKTKIAKIKKQMAMKGLIPTAVFCFVFKNNHDYKDTVESVNKNENINQDITMLSYEERVQRLAEHRANKDKDND